MVIKIKNGQVDMNRSQYQEIKKYDRNTLQNCMDEVYNIGFQDGAASISEKNYISDYITKVSDSLVNIKGIGAKKAAEITDIMIKIAEENADL